MEKEAFIVLVVTSALMLFLILGIVITLFVMFQKKKLSLLLEQQQKEKDFEEILKNSELEIKENALKNIAWELHDNIGQLLSLAKMELNMLILVSQNNKEKVLEISEIIGTSLQEIRTISKTLNAEYIHSIGLKDSILIEIDRFNRMKFIDAKLEVIGEEVPLPNNDEIILFRMIQEFFSNTIKHAKATKLDISLSYHPTDLKIIVKDNGKGFDLNQGVKGSGLLNMKSRAGMIHTEFEIYSDENGTQIKMNYPIK